MSETALYLMALGIWSAMGFVLIGVGIHAKRYQRKKEMAETRPVTGKIVDVRTRVTHGQRTRRTRYYVPVVEFTVDGKTYRLENENGFRDRDRITVGGTVDVMTDPKDPERFHLTMDDSNTKDGDSVIRLGVIWVASAVALVIVCMALKVF